MSRVANYCPKCGTALDQQHIHGRLRPVCSSCDFIIYHDPKVAVLAIIIQDDKVLLIKRAQDPGMGKWACPAGFVEYDEEPEGALIREVREETGLLVRIERILAVTPRKDHGLANIVISYQATVIDGVLQAGDDAAEARWFSRDEIPEMVFYPSIMLVGIRWRNGRL